jgi:hypothetical protein
MPSAAIIARFSGRFTAPNEISGAVGLLRPSSARSAIPDAMPSGPGRATDADLLARQVGSPPRVEILEMVELFVVVADQRAQAPRRAPCVEVAESSFSESTRTARS